MFACVAGHRYWRHTKWPVIQRNNRYLLTCVFICIFICATYLFLAEKWMKSNGAKAKNQTSRSHPQRFCAHFRHLFCVIFGIPLYCCYLSFVCRKWKMATNAAAAAGEKPRAHELPRRHLAHCKRKQEKTKQINKRKQVA